MKKVNIFEFPQAKGVVVSGDIHGDFTQLVYKCCVQYGMTDTLIVVAGDCGFGFERPGYYEAMYNKCSKRLSKANNCLAFIRGNHDNPAIGISVKKTIRYVIGTMVITTRAGTPRLTE